MTIRYSDDWLLLPQRLALHEPTATAVLADVHLGYSAARQRLGDAIPSRSVAEEMQPLSEAAKVHAIASLVVAGDLFERRYDGELLRQFIDVLEQRRIRFIGLVPGNHDRGIDNAGWELPILADGYDLAGWHVLHGDRPHAHAKAMQGHWHPAVRRGRRKHACFLARGAQLVLPAFSLDAAGVDVDADARWRDWQRWVIDGNQVLRANKEP